MKPPGPFAAASLIQLNADKPTLLVHLGIAPIRNITGKVATDLYVHAARIRRLVTSRAVADGIQKLGYMMAASGSEGTFVVSGAQSLPVPDVVSVGPNSRLRFEHRHLLRSASTHTTWSRARTLVCRLAGRCRRRRCHSVPALTLVGAPVRHYRDPRRVAVGDSRGWGRTDNRHRGARRAARPAQEARRGFRRENERLYRNRETWPSRCSAPCSRIPRDHWVRVRLSLRTGDKPHGGGR